jgi:hypothetical protein
LVGTNGIASNGNNPHSAQAVGYLAAAINAPNNGGPVAAITRWVVFCMPKARPLQNCPANSVIAVASNPLSSTAITEIAIMSGTSYRELR